MTMQNPLGTPLSSTLDEALSHTLSAAADSLSQSVKALLSHWQQTNRLLHLSIPGAAALSHTPLMPESLHGLEGLSPMQASDECSPRAAGQPTALQGFRFSLTALSTDAQLNPADFIGQLALIELQTALSRDDRRPFSGIVTGVACLGSNGGLARYRLDLQPWSWWLDQRADSYVFTDMTVLEIVESVLSDYAQGPQGEHIRWRVELSDASVYPVRGVTVQYQETDLQFLTRLLTDEGLYYFYEHAQDGHTLVITDDSARFAPNTQATIRFTQSSARLKEDSIDRWQVHHHVLPTRVDLQSWDYRSLSTRPVSSAVPSATELALQLEPGAYAYVDAAHGQRIADHLLQAFTARRQVVHGRSTVRSLGPGTTVTLRDHASAGDSPYQVISLWHEARNNVDVKMGASSLVTSLLGAASHLGATNHHDKFSRDARDNTDTDSVQHYRNHFTALRHDTAYRPLTLWQGSALYPKPRAPGTHTAIVVGQGDPLHSDRDHRVQIQYHWQRGTLSSSTLAHPSGENNAAAQAHTPSLWVRVATLDAGANMGSVVLPRVGQEVLVSFIGNDWDRPLIIGSVYNGQGAADAQHNQVTQGNAKATGNAPAWFAGEQGGHAHHAALSGIKSQALSTSQSGQGGYNQLVLDSTPQHGGVRLQTTQGNTQLNLGSLWQQHDNQRKTVRGYGAELTSQHSGAIRGGSGVLISSDAASAAQAHLTSPADSHLTQAQGTLRALNQHAKDQHAALAGIDAMKLDDKLINQLHDKLVSTQSGITSDSVRPELVEGSSSGSASGSSSSPPLQPKALGGGSGEAIAYSHPILVLSSPAGIAHFSVKDSLEVTGHHRLSVAADSSLTAQGNAHLHSAQGQTWFTAGAAPSNPRAITSTGMTLHAATGEVQLRALTGPMNLNADQQIMIASTQSDVHLSAPNNTLLLTAGGAAIELKAGQLTLTAPGNLTLSATQLIYSDAMPMQDHVVLAQSKVKGCAQQNAPALDALAPF